MISVNVIWNRRRLWRRLFYGLVVPLFLIFTLGNIVLNSHWAKRKVSDTLEKRTGEVWEIGTLTMAPNGVLHLYQIESQLDGGSVYMEHVSVLPNYPLLWDKQLRFSEMVIEGVEVKLTDVWILDRLASRSPDISDVPTTIASGGSEGEAGPVVVNAPKDDLKEEIVQGAGESSASAPKAKKRIAIKPKDEVSPLGNHDPADFYESWIRLRDVQLSVVSAYGEVLVVDGVNADLPTGGKDLTGELAWKGVSLLGRDLVSGGSLHIEKKGPLLSVKETEVDFFGVKLQPDVYLGQAVQGAAFHIDMHIPEQAVAELFTHLNLTVGISVDHVQGRMQLVGLANHPSTWRGLADVRARGIKAQEGHRGTTAYFENFQFQALLGRGVLQLPSVELRGEELSLMSNGVMRMDGDGYGVVRLVALPNKKDWINKLANGSGFFEGIRGSAMLPFETKDLYYMDLKLDGSLLSPMMQIDRKTDWQALWPAVIRLQQFIKEERREEQP